MLFYTSSCAVPELRRFGFGTGSSTGTRGGPKDETDYRTIKEIFQIKGVARSSFEHTIAFILRRTKVTVELS